MFTTLHDQISDTSIVVESATLRGMARGIEALGEPDQLAEIVPGLATGYGLGPFFQSSALEDIPGADDRLPPKPFGLEVHLDDGSEKHDVSLVVDARVPLLELVAFLQIAGGHDVGAAVYADGIEQEHAEA